MIKSLTFKNPGAIMYLKNERAGTLKPKSKTLDEPQIPADTKGYKKTKIKLDIWL